MKLRPYQIEAVNAIEAEWAKGNRKTLLVLPTGTGKTICFCKLAENQVRQGEKVLILAHRGELLDQAADKLSRATGLGCSVEKADSSCFGEWFQIVVGSVQTMMRPQRLAQFDPDYFGAVIVDEAHHSISESYQRILTHFSGANVLGVTATPDRGDMRELGEYFDSLAYEYTLPRAIKEGYLCKIKALTIPLQLDLRGVPQQSGDFALGAVGNALDPYLHQIADEMIEHCRGRRTLVFLPLIATSQKFQRILLSKGIEAGEVNGQSPDRAEKLADFASGRYDVLCNSMLLTEGYDLPAIDCVVCLRPTKIRSLYCLDTQTEILTATGWRKDVSAGEMVAAFDPETEEIRYVPALGTIRRLVGGDEYFISLKAQSADIRITNNHRMLYDHKRRTGWKWKTAEQLAALRDTSYIPVAGEFKSKGVPLSDDELRFIGWVMTDGTINKANGAITITQGKHQPWCENIQACIDGCGFKYGKFERKRTGITFNETSDSIVWTISRGRPRGRDKHLRGWGSLAPWLSKDFALPLMDVTSDQFAVLLEAIHEGDGAKQQSQSWTRRSYHIGTGNKTFADRLQICAALRGYRANVSTYTKCSALSKNLFYTVHLKKQKWSRVGGNQGDRPSWVIEQHAKEECWCVETSLGTLVTRRNGKVAIVGNCQLIGRGTRIHPGKDHLLLLDFLWLSDRHELCRPAHLIAVDKDVADKMTDEINAAGVPLDLEATEQKAAGDCIEEREQRLADRLREMRNRKRKLVDPLQFEMSIAAEDLANYVPAFGWEAKQPSEAQRQKLEQLGIFPDEIDAGKAEKIIERLQQRRADGLTTPKQIRFLESKGFQHVGTWEFDTARKLIDRIAGNNWRVPNGLDPQAYRPKAKPRQVELEEVPF